jgi:PAS domain S-box-containing protein
MQSKGAKAAPGRRHRGQALPVARTEEQTWLTAEAGRELQRANRVLSGQVRTLREHQRNLADARAHYEDLFDFAPVTYALLDGIGIVLKAYLAGCRLLEVERAHLIGHPLLAYVAPQDRRELLTHLRRCRSEGGVIESEIRLLSRGGAMVTCRLYSKKAVYQDRDAFPTVIVDQTEHLRLDEARLRAERQRQEAERASGAAQAANRSKDRFLAVVSHELRTPLTPALLAAGRLAAWEHLPEQVRSMAALIKRNIELEAGLIDDLLDVARINRKRLGLQFDTIDVHEVLREVVAVCRSFADGKGVTLISRLIAEDHHVRGDQARLRQVFWNVTNNAIKFTDVGGTVIIRSSNPEDSGLRISFRDSGVGMDAASLEHLFAPFEQRPLERESRMGLGLGLAISKGIVAAHGGHISASSDGPGHGSTFSIDLETVPTEPEPAADADETAATVHEAAAPQTALRILVVEDDPDSSEMLAMFLSHHGHEVEVASSLAEGLARLGEPWDLVVSDLGLPDGSGLEMARQARRLARPPQRLIAFTGYGSLEDIEASRDAGFDDHVVKPIDLDRLLETLRLMTPAGSHAR